ncbi:DUF397 domain-containing protein [Streptomyces sp. NPDC005132]|uniref:DUF397 domain-containing protein n=1 Tax=Streptomyces sp. NPDC005132 TaxID=3154294 RepID=UPI0033B822AA
MREASTGRQTQNEVKPSNIRWWKSSYSNSQGSCLEVALGSDGNIWFLDSKTHLGPVMGVTSLTAAWFVRSLLSVTEQVDDVRGA